MSVRERTQLDKDAFSVRFPHLLHILNWVVYSRCSFCQDKVFILSKVWYTKVFFLYSGFTEILNSSIFVVLLLLSFNLLITFSAQLYYTQESWVSVKKVLDRAYDLHKKKRKELSLNKIFGEFKPLPLDGLPLFTIGPRPASLTQEVGLEYFICAGFPFPDVLILSFVIIIRYSYYWCHHYCRFFFFFLLCRLKVLIFYWLICMIGDQINKSDGMIPLFDIFIYCGAWEHGVQVGMIYQGEATWIPWGSVWHQVLNHKPQS